MNENDQHPNPTDTPSSGPHRRRRYAWILLAVLVIVLVFIAAAPALLSVPPLRNAALGWYNDSIAGEVSVEDISLSWFGGQSARAVVVRESNGDPALRLARFTTDLTLLDALRGRFSLGRTAVTGLEVDLRFAADGTNNLAAALGGEPAADVEAGGDGLAIPVTGNMTLDDSRITIAAPDIDPILLENLSGDVNMAGPDAPVELRFTGQSRQGDLEGRIDVDGRIDDLFRDGRLDPENATAAVNASVEDLPVDALDQLLGLQGILSAALGDRTSLTVEAGGDSAQQHVTVDASSPNAQLHLEGAVADNWFRLRNPANARLVVTPALVDEINRLAARAPDARLAEPVPLVLSIERLDVPLEDLSPARVALESTLSADNPVRLTGIENIGDLSVNDLAMQVSSSSLGEQVRLSLAGTPVTREGTGDLTVEADVQQIIDDAGMLQLDKATVAARSSITGVPTVIVDAALQQDGLLVDALGDRFGLQLNADTDQQGRINVAVGLDSDRLQTDSMQLVVDEQISLAQPAQLRLAVTPRLGRRLLGDDAAYQLAETSEWTVELETLQVPVPTDQAPGIQPGTTQLKAAAASPSLQLQEPGNGQVTRLEDLRLDIGAADGLDEIGFSGSARVLQPGGTLESLDASPLRVALQGETGLNDNASLKSITSSLEASGTGLNATLNTVVEEGFSRLTLSEPSRFNATVTPELVTGWQDRAAPAVKLNEKATVQGTLDNLVVPLAPFQPAGVQASGKANLGGGDAASVSLQSPGGTVTRFNDTRVAFDFTGEDGGRGQLDLNARVMSDNDEPGNVSLKATVSSLLDGDGNPDAGAMSLELDGTLQHLPVALVDQLLAMEGMASATLGATADLELSTRLEGMRGPVSLTLTAPNAEARIKAAMGDQGLTLSEPLVAQINPTPEFGSQVLAKVHPIFETTQRAEQPIRFEVPVEGVLVPIEEFAFERIAVPEMTLDFGKIVLKSGWLLRGVIGLGQRLGKLESVQQDEWVAWFSPGVMEIKNGEILYSRRLDVLLAEKLHLATWGSADVSGDRSKLVLAFMPGTMERVFSITVAENDALHIPITGPLSSPNVDFKKAGTDLARLRAQEEVSGENPLAGALLGAVTGKATGSGGPVPPPSVTPLPWAGQLEALDAAEPRQQQPDPDAQEPSQAQQEPKQSEPKRKRSTEEQVIEGLIDIFGNKKKQ